MNYNPEQGKQLPVSKTYNNGKLRKLMFIKTSNVTKLKEKEEVHDETELIKLSDKQTK